MNRKKIERVKNEKTWNWMKFFIHQTHRSYTHVYNLIHFTNDSKSVNSNLTPLGQSSMFRVWNSMALACPAYSLFFASNFIFYPLPWRENESKKMACIIIKILSTMLLHELTIFLLMCPSSHFYYYYYRFPLNNFFLIQLFFLCFYVIHFIHTCGVSMWGSMCMLIHSYIHFCNASWMIKDKEKFMHENESDWDWNGGLIKCVWVAY